MVTEVKAAQFGRFQESATTGTGEGKKAGLELLRDVKLQLTVELGRASMTVRDVLELAPGSIVELDKLAGEPVDIRVNGKLIAHGEVVIVDENFGVKITEVISRSERSGTLA